MPRSAVSWVLLACFSASLVAMPRAAQAAAPRVVRCESSSRETVRCNADTSNGVTLQRQLSRAGCWYDETWGFDRRGIWVSNGCRADFALGRTAGVTPGSGAASSGSGLTGNDAAAAAAAALVAAGIAAAVISNRSNDRDDDRRRCRRTDNRGRCIQWSDGGRDPWRRDRIVRCESQGHRQRYCRVDTRRGVELYRRLSDARCRFGSTWGYDRRGIWVDRGCRADFLVRG